MCLNVSESWLLSSLKRHCTPPSGLRSQRPQHATGCPDGQEAKNDRCWRMPLNLYAVLYAYLYTPYRLSVETGVDILPRN
jgi:hypothetical protein